MGSNCIFIAIVFFSSCISVVFCDREGFLSLSCGTTSDYIDSSGIAWIGDGPYVKTGNISWPTNAKDSREDAPAEAVRFFPDSQIRKCYDLPITNVSSSVVLVRARFVYQNYDKLERPPAFSISIGTAILSTVRLESSDPWTEEILWPVKSETIVFCLHSLPGGGYPVISSLELRSLPQGAYQRSQRWLGDKSLRKTYRINCGHTDSPLRYPSDSYDRIWDPDKDYTPLRLSSRFNVLLRLNSCSVIEGIPAAILQTARVVTRRNTLSYNLPLGAVGDYFVVLYFAGILPVSPLFDVYINGNLVRANFTFEMNGASAIQITERGIKNLNITLRTSFSYLQINAIEVYELLNIPDEVSPFTVSALRNIQQSAGIDAEWEDDPCSPVQWDHVGCEGSLITSLKFSDIDLSSTHQTFGNFSDLISLDLHNSSIAGAIKNIEKLKYLQTLNLSYNKLTSFGTELTDLVSLRVLDLRNNSLNGVVPENLGYLENLHLLNLENNNLDGILPRTLFRKHLEVRTLGNRCLSLFPISCSSNMSVESPQATLFPLKKHRKEKHLNLAVACVAGSLVIALLISLSLLLHKWKASLANTYSSKKHPDCSGYSVEMKKLYQERKLSYREIKVATSNFKEAIGYGRFGYVYNGKLSDGKQAAVKVKFNQPHVEGDAFINEVYVLSRLRHENVVSFEGFCYEAKQQILVYEYMQGGSLAARLYGSASRTAPLNWLSRLKIAVGAAKGLDYLHNGFEQKIVHGAVKSSNILLDKEMNAKICDVGLTNQHVISAAKGTSGYIDPEYYATQQLTEKSDVYSFGVVLLELICGREPLRRRGSPDSFNLVLWAKPYLQADAYEVVDERLEGDYDVSSMRKAASAAVKCVEIDASRRPATADLLAELTDALDLQLRNKP